MLRYLCQTDKVQFEHGGFSAVSPGNQAVGHRETATPYNSPVDPLEFSRYARQLVTAKPELWEELERAEGGGWTREAMQSFLREQGAGDEAALHSALRRLRQRVLLRTMARDLSGAAGLDEVCGTMSALAEVAIDAALAHFGHQDLIVVGMGKLGGGELNVSSDVDLVFLYPEEGQSDGGREGSLEFFTRLGRRLIAALDERTADGFVFRVDMRLRPWGDSGALATSFDALEEYFVTQGREWERYARSEEHTSELQSHHDLVCRLLLEKKKKKDKKITQQNECA